MRLCRFLVDGRASSGVIEDDLVFEVKEGDVLGCAVACRALVIEKGEKSFPLSEVRLLPPVLPSKVVAIGLNYRAHALEYDLPVPEEPMLLLKPPSSVIGPDDEIVYPSHMSRRVDIEAELGVVIGRTAKDVEVEDAKDFILGYTSVNDVTARDLQKRDVQFVRSKGFDTFTPIGPSIVTEGALDPKHLEVMSFVNKEKRQDSSSSDMVFDVYEIVSFVSSVMTLLPGDVIATGTPAGNGKVKPGDEVEISIEGIGVLRNPVRDKGEG